MLATMVKAASEYYKIPVCFHLDHGPSEKEVTIALRRGCTGIMLDGSVHPFDENVAFTKSVVDVAKVFDVDVEGELGHVGSVAAGDAQDDESTYTVPEEAAKFAELLGEVVFADTKKNLELRVAAEAGACGSIHADR